MLILTINTIIKELTKLAVTIYIIPNVISQTYAYTLQQPFTVLYNKASKAPKIGTVTILIFSYLYITSSSLLKILSNLHVLHILFSNIY